MRVVVIGGGGVFGARLARMLLRDGHDVIVAGRRRGPLDAIGGAQVLILDRAGNLAPLWALAPSCVVDAAGPFHAYGRDPYRLAREALDHGCHYLDLADDAVFCTGIAALDAEAKAAGRVALSGVSSVPALSSAIVADLAKGLSRIDLIESAILPGNRAPRGRAVMESILHQAGTPIAVTVDGRQTRIRSWSAPRTVRLPGLAPRRAYAIRVPDTALFPAAFGARTVRFHAGLELPIMARGLAALSWLRARTGLRAPVTPVLWLAERLERFGTDAGGMEMRVTGQGPDGPVIRRWSLVVRDGDGPCIPGIAARAILREIDGLPHGAGPAIAPVSRAAMEAAMADLSVRTESTDEAIRPLFPRALSPAFDRLPAPVRATHRVVATHRWSGEASVTRGRGLFARLAATLFRFPPPSAATPVIVTKTRTARGETWERRFGDSRFRSHLGLRRGGIAERFGPFDFDLGLHVVDDALHFPVTGGRFFGILLPGFALPRSVSREYAKDGRFHFDVALHAPFRLGLVVHYRGWLVPEERTDAHDALR